MTAVCLQVRLDSTRLPEKALKVVEDMTIIEHAMKALREIQADMFLLLTTDECIDRLQLPAEKWGFTVFSGPKEDVLLRFVKAAEKYDITTIIRATGDNPLVSSSLANMVLKEHHSLAVDYSNWTDSPLGTGIEVVEAEVLKLAVMQTETLYDHEHVTPWIYNNPDLFQLNIKKVPDKYIFNSKVSVDTAEDMAKIKKIFQTLYKGQPIRIEDLIDYLKQEEQSEK
jgi:spore coat polysaccharide biosynthesis protein SpsF